MYEFEIAGRRERVRAMQRAGGCDARENMVGLWVIWHGGGSMASLLMMLDRDVAGRPEPCGLHYKGTGSH